MNTLIKTIATAIALTAIATGSASACDTLNDKAQALKLDGDQNKELTFTPFSCDESDAVADELRLRLGSNDSVFSKIVKSASRSVKTAPKS